MAVVLFSAAALITGRTAGVGASRAPRPRGCRRGTGGGRGRSRPRGGRRRSSRLPSTRSTELSPAPEARRGGRPRQLPVGHGRGRRRPGSAARGARRGSRAKSRRSARAGVECPTRRRPGSASHRPVAAPQLRTAGYGTVRKGEGTRASPAAAKREYRPRLLQPQGLALSAAPVVRRARVRTAGARLPPAGGESARPAAAAAPDLSG